MFYSLAATAALGGVALIPGAINDVQVLKDKKLWALRMGPVCRHP